MYQYAAELEGEGAFMEGKFTYVEGSLARAGMDFSVALPRMYLRIPDYIF